MTWFLRGNDWRDGRSGLAQKLVFPVQSDGEDETLSETNTQDANAVLMLFVRIGNSGNFLCCGRCRAQRPEMSSATKKSNGDASDWELVQLNLELLDYDALLSCEDFMQLVSS